MIDDYPVTIETPDSLEKSILFDLARCCRDWPVAILMPIGRCGYCGERPVPRPLRRRE